MSSTLFIKQEREGRYRASFVAAFFSICMLMWLVIFVAASVAVAAPKRTLRVATGWQMRDEPGKKWAEFLVKEFRDVNPNVELKFEEEYGIDKILVCAAAGTLPDVLLVEAARDAETLYRKGIITKLNDFVRLTPELGANQFFGALSSFFRTGEGDIFGIPVMMDAGFLIYNIDCLESAGLDASPDAMSSWDRFVEYACKLAKTTPSGMLSVAYGEGAPYEFTFPGWLYSNGGQFMDFTKRKLLFNTFQGLQTLEFIYDITNKYKIGGGARSAAEFTNGTLPLFYGGATYVGNWTRRGIGPRFSIMGIPKGPNGAHPGATAWAHVLTIPTTSKEKELAWEIVKVMCSLRGSLNMFNTLGFSPPRIDVYRSDVWRATAMQFKYMGILPQIFTLAGPLPMPGMSEWGPKVRTVIGQMVSGAIAPGEALDKMEREVNLIISR